MSTPTLVLVPGAWCGPWVFWKLGPCLDARQLRWVGVDLPSCSAGDPATGPADDAAHVAAVLDGIDGPAVLVGKSYAGAVITGASAGRSDVARLVYVAAFMPQVGEPFQRTTMRALLPDFAAGVQLRDDGLTEMDADVGARCGFTDASSADQDVWRRERRPMSMGDAPSFGFDAVGWDTIESTYVVCGNDRALDPVAQGRWAQQATEIIERPYDHSPGVSRPDEFADLLAEIVRGVNAS